jgi:hypothetical protein
VASGSGIGHVVAMVNGVGPAAGVQAQLDQAHGRILSAEGSWAQVRLRSFALILECWLSRSGASAAPKRGFILRRAQSLRRTRSGSSGLRKSGLDPGSALQHNGDTYYFPD